MGVCRNVRFRVQRLTGPFPRGNQRDFFSNRDTFIDFIRRQILQQSLVPISSGRALDEDLSPIKLYVYRNQSVWNRRRSRTLNCNRYANVVGPEIVMFRAGKNISNVSKIRKTTFNL